MHIKINENEVTYMYADEIPIDITLDPTSTMPSYAHSGDAGMDLVASEDIVLTPFKPEAVPTGIKIAIPVGYEGQVRPRSGLSLKGVTVYNAPGTIDCSYRGEVKAILMYIPPSADKPIYEIKKGDRIAQLVIAKCYRAQLNPALFLVETVRGEGGFGSSGI